VLTTAVRIILCLSDLPEDEEIQPLLNEKEYPIHIQTQPRAYLSEKSEVTSPTMPPTKQEIELSDDDFDEILSDEDEVVKPDKNNVNAVLKGSLSKPRHTLVSAKSLHGKSSSRGPTRDG
jgi:CBS-domain-containing membrane protein